MTIDRNLLDKLRSRGEEVLTQLSSELTSNPRFMKAMEGAMRGREKLEQAAASALEQMNLPTRGDLERANSRIAALEREISALRARARATRASAAAAPAARAKVETRRAGSPKRKAAAARSARRAKAGNEPDGAV